MSSEEYEGTSEVGYLRGRPIMTASCRQSFFRAIDSIVHYHGWKLFGSCNWFTAADTGSRLTAAYAGSRFPAAYGGVWALRPIWGAHLGPIWVPLGHIGTHLGPILFGAHLGPFGSASRGSNEIINLGTMATANGSDPPMFGFGSESKSLSSVLLME